MTECSIGECEAVLVVTAPDDSTADAVEIELKKAVRLGPADRYR
ncbi:MAG: hypothetical protein ACRDUV_18530 [Pseudonocardiaceae bacterium]